LIDDKPLIVIKSDEDLKRLLRWRDRHKELVRNYKPPLRAGIIQYGEKGEYRQEFEFLDDWTVRHEYLAGGILKSFGFDYDRKTWQVVERRGILTHYPVDLAIEDIITVHATCMAILQYARHHVQKEGGTFVIKIKEEEDIG